MERGTERRLAALERAMGASTIPIGIVDEDGRIVAVLPAAGRRPFDWDALVLELASAMGWNDETLC